MSQVTGEKKIPWTATVATNVLLFCRPMESLVFWLTMEYFIIFEWSGLYFDFLEEYLSYPNRVHRRSLDWNYVLEAVETICSLAFLHFHYV